MVPEQALVDEQGLNKSCSGKGHLLLLPIMMWEMFLSGGPLHHLTEIWALPQQIMATKWSKMQYVQRSI